MLGQDSNPVPFPTPLTVTSTDGTRLEASGSGAVDGCTDSPCKVFVENYIGSSSFHEVLVPGSPGTPGTVTANLSIGPPTSGCGRALELRIFDQEEDLFYSSEGQTGDTRVLGFPLDSSFRRGSYLLIEAAGDTETPPGSGHGQKASYAVTVRVD